MVTLLEKYNKEVIPAMKKKFGYTNNMAVPRIEKVVINTGFGKQITAKGSDEQKKTVNFFLEDISLIAGQKAIVTKAKKSISSFKLREGMPVGVKVTLRKKKMNDFLERFVGLALPRCRDFRGINSKSVDGKGNLNTAIKEHIAFPEIMPEKAKFIFSLEVTVATNAKSHEEGLELFKLLGFPIKKT